MRRQKRTTVTTSLPGFRTRKSRLWPGLAAGGALLLGLTACGSDDPLASNDGNGDAATADTSADSSGTDEATGLSGMIAGAGASSQEAAMDAWRAGFQNENPDVTISYDPVGSGGGRTQFLEGGTLFAGSDSAMSEEELEQAAQRCEGDFIEAPLYISPIAVVYNLPEVEELNLSAETIAQIFNQDITTWNDPAIAAENPDADLPDLPITPVSRSDESGTTDNFTDYLAEAAGDAWPHEPSGNWPVSGGQSAQGTSGVIQTVQGAEGTIGYADASRAGNLGVVSLKVGENYVPYSAEAAAAVVDASPRAEGRPEHSFVVELDRATTAEGAYPLVLISYSIACLDYPDAEEAEIVKSFLSHIASEEGQNAAAQAAGSAPISEQLRSEILAALNS